MLRVTTETETVYEFDMDALKVRRVSAKRAMRLDTEWLQMLQKPEIVLGYIMCIALEPFPDTSDDICTMRITSAVSKIEEFDG